jgi:hypothetical protein
MMISNSLLRSDVIREWLFLVVIALILAPSIASPSPFPLNPGPASTAGSSGFHYPNVSPNHQHMRLLLDNAFEYVNPAHGIIDPVSGYPVEGWNQEPQHGLFLRSFTQLTAIGAWIELLANVAAGYADNPYLSKESALSGLSLAVTTLLDDQRNPALAAKGLLVNFLALDGGKRSGPLLETVEKRQFIEVFGTREGNAIWSALVEKGWLQEEDDGRKGSIRRGPTYGWAHFDGVLAPYSRESLQSTIMGILDQRAVTIIFGDNANLTAALARSVGALLRPEVRDDPGIAELRAQIERFIEGQREGYSHLFDPETGTFVFGWDAVEDRFVGWGDGRGNWVTGQMNYFINEFRGPWIFAVLRYDLPVASIRNAGFKIKPYRHQDGRDTYALAAWDGSAFQLMGLSLFMQEADNPSWRRSLETLLDIEIEFSNKHGLPGFLSESYSGNGTEYTGLIGIPDIAVTDHPLITHAPSLYSLGVGYMIAPEKMEGFLRTHWPKISALFTPHGPWEGWNTSTDRVIPYQTTVHTLSLILGGINSAQETMRRYLEEKGLYGRLEALYRPGDRLDLLAPGNQVLPWTSDGSHVDLACEEGTCRFSAALAGAGGMTFVLPDDELVSLSNGRLVMRYASETAVKDVLVSFKRAADDPLPPPTFPVEILARLEQTQDDEIEVVLPATPALSGIREIALTFRAAGEATPVDVSILAFDFIPFDAALDAPR